MSIERELLKRWLIDFGKIHPDVGLIKDTKELLAQPEQDQEPVAWIIETEIYGKLSEWVCTDKKRYMEAHDGTKDPIPLYLAPQKREPLSEDAVDKCLANAIKAGWYPVNEDSYRQGFWDAVKFIGGGDE